MRGIERFLWGAGLVMACLYALARGDGALMERRAVQAFTAERAAPSTRVFPAASVDTHLWSAQRIRDYERSLVGEAAPTLAVLRIPRIHLEVPVFDGTDDLTLNRGVGRIAGTARLGETGNLGIAGHRDGYFRGLKDIGVGDEIALDTRDATELYRVSEMTVVDPSDVGVLDPTSEASLTLVTCYPFYFVGSAPKRYIVRATRIGHESDTTKGRPS
jgi:sortase A